MFTWAHVEKDFLIHFQLNHCQAAIVHSEILAATDRRQYVFERNFARHSHHSQ